MRRLRLAATVFAVLLALPAARAGPVAPGVGEGGGGAPPPAALSVPALPEDPAAPWAAPSAAPPQPRPAEGAHRAEAEDGVCARRAQVVARLTEVYGETRRGYGLRTRTSVVELYASAATGSWTLVMTTPGGLACLLAAGRDWTPAASPVAAEPGDPA